MKKQKAQTGFTLIELLVVISIIGILTALLLANFVGIRERASDARLKSDAVQLKNALRLYYNDFQQYPVDSGTSTIMGCGSAGTTACSGGSAFSAGTSTYMKQLPLLSYYNQLSSGEGFVACVTLQNEGDSDIATSQDRCIDAAGGEPAGLDAEDYCVCND